MADSPTTRNRFRKQEVGAKTNAWGTDWNEDGGSDRLDEALDGVVSFTLSGTKTLASTNYETDEARMRIINVTGGTGGTITIPAVEKWYQVHNGSTGAITITNGSNSVTLAAGEHNTVISDGTNLFAQNCKTYVDAAILNASLTASLPSQAGNTGRFLGTNGSLASWTPFTSAVITTALGFTPTSITGMTGAQTAAQIRTGLNLVIGTDVQAYSGNLTTYAGITPSANVQTLLGSADFAAIRSSLGFATVASSGSAADLTGNLAVARLNSGSGASSSTFWRGDGTWGNPSLANFNEALASSSPNSTVRVSSLSATVSTTNGDFAIIPKGTGALLAAVPDSGTAGGNKRGANATDLQTSRTIAARVASGQYAVVSGGSDNLASGVGSMAPGGVDNQASGDYSIAKGRSANARSRAYVEVFGAGFGLQRSIFTLQLTTTTATPTAMSADGTAASASNQILVPTDSTYGFYGYITARRSDADNESAFYEIKGCIDNNAGTTALVGTVTKTVIAEDTTPWDIAVTADNANSALAITVTGTAASTIWWLAEIHTIEINK